MNKLKGTSCYLVGPMDRVPDRGATWRLEMVEKLEAMGVTVFNPLNKPIEGMSEDTDFAAKKHSLKQARDWTGLAQLMRPIRNVDLRMCDKADFIVAYINLDIHLCGSYNEIFDSNRAKKPVLLMCEQSMANIPDWLFGALPHELFFDSWDDMLAYLQRVDSGEDTRTFGRWIFFTKPLAKVYNIGDSINYFR